MSHRILFSASGLAVRLLIICIAGSGIVESMRSAGSTVPGTVEEKLHRLAEHFDAHTSLLDSLHIFLGLALCMLGIEPLRPDLYPLHHWLRFLLHLRPRKSPERITFSPQCIPFPSQRASRSYMQLLLARGSILSDLATLSACTHQPSLPRQSYLRTPSQPARVRSTSPASTQLHTHSSRRLDIRAGVQEGRLSC
jgi:hypothetical protein